MKEFNRAKSDCTQIVVIAAMEDLIDDVSFHYLLDEIDEAVSSNHLDHIYQHDLFELHSMISD